MRNEYIKQRELILMQGVKIGQDTMGQFMLDTLMLTFLRSGTSI
jgi:uncharacterized membrane protein